MVQKSSHRGVHSGNTLRAYNSRYSRRYHSQACIVFRARPDLLQKLESETGPRNGDSLTQPKVENVAVDVALSLNKQARWLLPSALIHQIDTNNIADPDLTVSVLERHKLKRPANCVSFHSNRGDVRRIQCRNGRYVGYRFPRADGKSWRSLRRDYRIKRAKLEAKKAATLKPGATMEVFTERGTSRGNPELGESEVRYEVFYPSPASSSISHNPKYIKQDMNEAFEDEDQHVQHGKPKKQHQRKQRRRMALKDLEDWELHSCHSYPYHTLPSHTRTVNQEEFALLRGVREERNSTECLLSSLIEKAEQLQTVKGVAKPCRKKGKISLCQEDDKSHIVYVGKSQQHTVEDEVSDEASPAVQPPAQPPVHPVSPVPPEVTRVMLPKTEVTMENLRGCFGECYFEASCAPRKFILDITASVRELLKKQGIQVKVAENTEEALSYLICVHDGLCGDEYDIYRVLLNSRLYQGLLAVEIDTKQEDLFRGTVIDLISQTMDFMQKQVTVLKDKRHFPVFFEDELAKILPRQLKSHLGSSEIYVPSVKRVFQRGFDVCNITRPVFSSLLEEGPVFCDICYDDVSPLVQGSASFTSLLKCDHHVCDSCWSHHIHTRLHEGFVRLTCPGYDCQEEVKVGVLLSVAPLDAVDKMLRRQEEVRIGASQTEKWCPNKTCGRVISLQTSLSSGKLNPQQDVVCVCGTHVCFQCLMPSHWPASCTQAEEYRANLSSAVFPDRLAEVHDDFEAEEEAMLQQEMNRNTMVVEGKLCPKCKNFVNKNGGCPQMTCRCGQEFCWFCAQPGYSHPDRECVDEAEEKKLTTTIVVHHLDFGQPAPDTKKEQPASGASRRQRVSLMERAHDYRQQRRQKKSTHFLAITPLAKAVSTAAVKNKVLCQHITAACSGAFSSSDIKSEQDTMMTISKAAFHLSAPVLDTVTAFLEKAAHSQQELLELVEYSMVLLKDVPDSLLRRRALRVTEDLGAFCSFSESVFDMWGSSSRQASQMSLQEAVKAVMRLAEIQGWIQSTLGSHVATFRKLRSLSFPQL